MAVVTFHYNKRGVVYQDFSIFYKEDFYIFFPKNFVKLETKGSAWLFIIGHWDLIKGKFREELERLIYRKTQHQLTIYLCHSNSDPYNFILVRVVERGNITNISAVDKIVSRGVVGIKREGVDLDNGTKEHTFKVREINEESTEVSFRKPISIEPVNLIGYVFFFFFVHDVINYEDDF